MTVATTTAESGMVLGLVVVLLAQQLGLLPLPSLLATIAWVIVGVVVGGVVLGVAGWLADRR